MHGMLCWREAVVAAAAFFAVGPSGALAQVPSEDLPRVVRVTETFDERPFSYCMTSRAEKTGFSLCHLTYPSPVVTKVEQNNTVPAEYYLPQGIRPGDPGRPAVVCLHILDGNFELARMTCSVLASHGIPAMMFKLPYYGERGSSEGPSALAADPEMFASALSQALEDVRRAVDVLASRPEVDAERIGITGISLGGITAATAAAVDPRLSRVALILAGGDLESIIHHARETRELSALIRGLPPARRARVEEAIKAVDPLQHAEGLRARAERGRVLMVNATEDEVIPPACSEKLAAALGLRDEVVWLDGLGHYTAMAELPRILKTTVEFFGREMPSGLRWEVPRDRARTAVQTLAALVHQAATAVALEPEPGRCHFVDLDLSVTPQGKDAVKGRLSFVRGTKGRFKLRCTLPEVGEAAVGQNRYPWMVSGGKIVFKGVSGFVVPPSGGKPNGGRPKAGLPAATDSEVGLPLARADSRHVAKLRMLAGAAGGVALAPDILNQFCTIKDGARAGQAREIHVALTGGNQGSLRIELRDDLQTPRAVTFDVEGVTGQIVVRGWQINTIAHPSMFDPPAGLPVKEVDCGDLHRVFAAAFDFAMERME